MTNRTTSYIVSVLLCISICFNTKLSEAPPLFLSNLILFFLDTFLLIKVVFHLRSKIFNDIKPVLILFIVIVFTALLSFNNKNIVSVFPKLVLGIFTYYSFSRYFLLYYKDASNLLFGLCLGVALSPFFQVEVSDLTSLSTANRIKVDNLGNFNAYAFLIATSLICSIYLLTKIKAQLNKLIFVGMQLPLLIVLLLTLSRGGVFALVIGFLLYNFSVNKKTKIYLFLFTIFVVVIIGNVLVQMDGTDLFLNRFLNSEKEEDFDSGRSIVYLFLLNDLFSSFSSFLFGFGIGAIEIDVSAEIPLISAHNTYLDVFYSFGILGLVVFIRYLFYVYKGIKLMPKSAEKSISVALFGQIVFCLFYDSYWGATQIGWIFPFFFAFFVAQSQTAKHSSQV